MNNQKQKPYIVLGQRSEMDYKTWIELRNNQGIGGSDAGTACGINPWKTKLQLWCEKVGVTPAVKADNPHMKFGRLLEPIVRDAFAAETGFKVKTVDAILASRENPFMFCNLDGVCVDDDGMTCVLECKCASTDQDWKDGGTSPSYYCQVQHYLYVCNLQRAYIAVLIAGWDFRIVRVDRDDAAINAIIQMEKDFWFNHVKANVPPAAAAADNSNGIMNQLYPAANDKTVTLADEFTIKLNALAEIKAKSDELKRQKDALEAEIKMAMKEAATATAGEWKITYKSSTRSSFDTDLAKSLLSEADVAKCVKTTEVRTLRISKAAAKKGKSK